MTRSHGSSVQIPDQRESAENRQNETTIQTEKEIKPEIIIHLRLNYNLKGCTELPQYYQALKMFNSNFQYLQGTSAVPLNV